MNISIVDNNKDFVEAMLVVLSMVDCVNILYTASNGKEFISHPNFQNIDMVFTDINMPVMDGFKATKAAKRLKPEMVIVAVTNIEEKLGSMKSFEVGMNAYLEKDNISRSVLTDIINKFSKRINNRKVKL